MSAESPTRLTVVTPSDPVTRPIGGIASFLAGMIRFAPSDFELSWIGTSQDPDERPIGRWTVTRVHDHEIRVFPLIEASGEPHRWVPLSLRFTAQLIRRRSLVADVGHGILQFHRPGVALPFLRSPAAKVQVLHLDPAAVRTAGGESRWRHAPSLFRRSEGLVVRQMDAVFCVNEALVDELRIQYPAHAGRIHFLPNWFDPAIFHAASRTPVAAHDRPAIVFVGRLELTKDPGLALDAFARLIADGTDARMVVVGDGRLRNELADKAALPPLAGHVEFVGSRDQVEVGALLRTARALIISSRNEAGPTIAVEALASGLPVVAPSVGRIERLVEHAATGWIARERSAAALADGLRWALGQEEVLTAAACTAAAAPYRAERVLEPFYAEHRRLANRPSAG